MGRSTHICPGNANFYGGFWFKILSSMIAETIIAVEKQLNQEIPQKLSSDPHISQCQNADCIILKVCNTLRPQLALSFGCPQVTLT